MFIKKPYLKLLHKLKVETLARKLWKEHGQPQGQDETIWLEAESQILNPIRSYTEYFGRKIPVDPMIPFFRTKPQGIELHDFGNNHLYVDGKEYYYCEYCGGWVQGRQFREYHNSLGPLCGRRGYSTFCIRCEQELDFFGMVS